MNESTILIISSCLTVVIIIITVLVHLNIFKNYHYVCIKCRTSYKPTTFLQSLLGINGGEQRKLKCPNCNKREWANMINDKNDVK